jgi:lantibiotic transport system ATP-binding protein
MTNWAIEADDVSHQFGHDSPVLTDLRLRVPVGSIYGFLGPNGAGKTTTMRLLLGLLRIQRGHISVFGQSLPGARTTVLRTTGSLIESPSIYGQLSARENLRVWQVLYGCDQRRIAQVLTMVGLDRTGTKPAGAFSLGMRQRLGVAIALLHSPSLLVLDEPSNGLDPHGIVDMRTTLTALSRDEGITVLVSSHLLSEVERLVTHVGVIRKGRMVFEGRLAELTTVGGDAAHTIVECDAPDRARDVLRANTIPAWLEHGRLCSSVASAAELAALNRLLVLADIQVSGIASRRPDLESIFMDLVRE